MRRIVRRALATVVVLTCTASVSCSSPHGGGDPRYATTGFDDVYEQPLMWGSCADEALDRMECATIDVPMDWSTPERTDRISIALSRLRATGAEPVGSILLNPGGPGASGLNLPGRMGGKVAELRQSYDLVGFDPRGIGSSNPMKCGDDSSIDELNFAQCIADNEITHFMGTSSVARDMDVIRALLGDSKLNYLGYSYGTVLGATYAHLFPDLVGKVVLDSALSSGWADPVGGFDQSVAIYDAIDRYVDSCSVRLLGGTQCRFDSRESFESTAEALQAKPLVSSSGETFDGNDFQGMMVTALYSPPEKRAKFLALLSRAFGGNQTDIDTLIANFSNSQVDANGEIVRCHSQRVPLELVPLVAHLRELGLDTQQEVDSAVEQFAAVSSDCALLAETGTDVTEPFTAPGSAPILVVGIVGDHATPYQYSEKVVDELGNARLLTLEGDGHGASYRASSCIDDRVTAYFVDGSLPDEGMRCTYDPGVEDVPTVNIASAAPDYVTMTGSATLNDRVELTRIGSLSEDFMTNGNAAQSDPEGTQYVDVNDEGSWGPVVVQPACYEIRSVAPGRVSDPLTACVDRQ